MDYCRKTAILRSMYRALHPKADVDGLYLKRVDGGRGMISVEDCVNIEVLNLHKYVTESLEAALQAVQQEEIFKVRIKVRKE